MSPVPNSHHNDSDGDSDAPEAISLSSSKKISEAQTKAIRAHEMEQRAKKKNENRERDRLLKEEKAQRIKMNDRQHDSKEIERARMTTVEGRMERAMKQAEEEDSEGEENDAQVISDEMDEDDFEEEWHGLDDENQIAVQPTPERLPDHVFAAAASISHSATNTSNQPTDKISDNEKKKKKRRNKAKELIVGNRAIKVLSSITTTPTDGQYQPPPKVNKFIERRLQLRNQDVTVATTPSLAKRSGATGRPRTSKDGLGTKSNNPKISQSKGWNRIPVNLGSMRRSNGPAKNFLPLGAQSVAVFNVPHPHSPPYHVLDELAQRVKALENQVEQQGQKLRKQMEQGQEPRKQVEEQGQELKNQMKWFEELQNRMERQLEALKDRTKEQTKALMECEREVGERNIQLEQISFRVEQIEQEIQELQNQAEQERPELLNRMEQERQWTRWVQGEVAQLGATIHWLDSAYGAGQIY